MTSASVQFFGSSGIVTFAASLCYAKITPAVVRCSDFDGRDHGRSEAAGCRPEFEIRETSRAAAGAGCRRDTTLEMPGLARS
jgi:hypothetical protein